MASVAKVEGVNRVLAKLRHLAKVYSDSPNKTQDAVLVGYTQAYAPYVHENRAASFKVGRAGFLLDVARELGRELGDMIAKGLKRRLPMVQALLLAGLRLQRESQLNCPVDTGALRGSAFTRIER